MTSVEWLISKLGISEITHKKLFEQAKQMHKQEMATNCSQQEISDEEIYTGSIEYDNGATYETPIGHFISGAKWYREQLKQTKKD